LDSVTIGGGEPAGIILNIEHFRDWEI